MHIHTNTLSLSTHTYTIAPSHTHTHTYIHIRGLLAAIVGIGADWAGDIRFGFCSTRGWWTTRRVCCKDAPSKNVCPAFVQWHAVLVPLEKEPETELLLTYASYVGMSVSCHTHTHTSNTPIHPPT